MACLIQGLQQLPDDAGLAQLFHEPIESFSVLRLEVDRTLSQQLAFAEHGRSTTIVATVEQIGEESLEDPKDLVPHGGIGIELQQIEEHVQGAASNISLVLRLQLASEIADLGLVQEIEGGIDIAYVDQALRPGRSLLSDLCLPFGRARTLLRI